MNETELMLEVKGGNLDCSSLLFEKYSVRLYNFFLRQTRQSTLSEDLTQSVFERMLKYRHSFNPEFGFNAWIFQLARNVMYDSFRRNKHERTTSWDEDTLESETNDRLQEQEEQYAQLQMAISQLKPDEQELIELHRFQKLKYHEIAHITGSTTSAIKMKASRTMKRLKDLFFQTENK